MAAMRMMAASMPLHPASMDTAKPLVVLCRIFPLAMTFGSNSVTVAALMCASASVQGITSAFWTGGVNSAAKQRDQNNQEKHEESSHACIMKQSKLARRGS